VRSYTKNHLGGYTQVDTNMDWAGRTIYTITKHKRTNAATELVVKDMFTYSPQDKLLVHRQKINALPEQLISSNTYDDLGQLISKNVGGTDATGAAGLQKVDYAYNIRGWLKQINEVDNLQDDLFAFKINYNDATTATKLYNGNISETFWKTSTDNVKRKYDYKYDDLNRLLQADYSKQGNTAFNSYLEHLWYDKNGNIKNLLRNGGMDTDGYQFANPIDNLTYLYDTDNKNQLLRVFDATANPQGFKDDPNGTSLITEKAQAPDYGYDANGNMTKDDNKGIKTITYNHLNLPTKITFANPNNITYLYNATGQKVNKVVTEKIGTQTIITTTDYLNGYQYVNNILQFFPHAEGYVKVTGTSYDYVYNYTDHLGNIRLSYSKEPATNALKVIEENHYYPFGLKHTGYNSDQYYIAPSAGYSTLNYWLIEEVEIKPFKPANFNLSLNYDYKYNGKEYQDELGLNITAMDYRQYDSAIGRFNSIDVLSELAPSLSPYRFGFNNPVFFSDPTGLYEVDKNGNINITNPNEIKTMLGYLNHNQGASVKDIENHINDEKNGYIKEVQLNEVTVSSRNSKSIDSFQNNVQSQMERHNNQTIKGVSFLGIQMNDFAKGFIGSDPSNMTSASAWIGYAGLQLTKTSALIKYVNPVLDISKKLSRKIGVIGVGVSVLEDINNNNVGYGTLSKVGIGLATTFAYGTLAPVALIYTLLDIGVGLYTGTSITDRIANGIDNATKN
jgi:RHS repeat-associated protein